MSHSVDILDQTRAAVPWAAIDVVTELVLAELETREQKERVLAASLPPEALGQRRDEFLLSVGRATGMLLDLLVRESRARRILELGTSRGYSTIWLADAARATGGTVSSVDVSADKQAFARTALERAGLKNLVQFHTGDAVDFLVATKDTYDFALLDLWKDVYVPTVDALLGHLETGAIIVADNMIEPPIGRASAARYLRHLEGIPDLQTIVVPVGNGVAISRYKSRLPQSGA